MEVDKIKKADLPGGKRPFKLFYVGVLGLEGLNRNVRLVIAFFLEYNCSVNLGVQGVVFANTYVFTGIVTGTALANDDVTGDTALSSKNFHAKALTF